MNFLQLCRATAIECGTVAGVPNFTTVAAASGRVAQVVGWVRDAYIDIQNERGDWLWMVHPFEAQLTIDQLLYTGADLGVSDLGSWIHDRPAEGWNNLSLWEDGYKEREGEILEIPYPVWRNRYQRGVHDANQPTEWAVTPQGLLAFGNKPDKAYWVAGEYRMAPEELTADADVPSMPEAYHRLIIHEAIRLMARSDEAFQVLVEKTQQYERLRNPLVREQTPQLTFGGGTFA